MDLADNTADRSRLIVFAGLPGSGKSTIVDQIAAATGIPVLSVDPIEEGLHRAGMGPSFMRGRACYLVAAQVAEHLLGLGQRVIIEACNAEAEGRETWHALGRRCHVTPFWIEVRCNDLREHRRRLESRVAGYPGVDEPTWKAVRARASGFAGWADDRLVLDSTKDVDRNVAEIEARLR